MCQFDIAIDPDFFIDTVAIRIDGFDTDKQLIRDLLRALAVDDHHRYLFFAITEQIKGRAGIV